MRTSSFLLCAVLVVIAVVASEADTALRGDSRTITHVTTSHRVVALTIDDGPHYKTTPEVLSVLKEKNVHVTFFVLGSNVDQRPDILASEVAAGHEVAVHGYHHNSLTTLDKALISDEMEKTEKAISRVSNKKPTLFRPPGGLYNDEVIAAAREKGYAVVLWDIDTLDWTRPSVDKVVNSVLKKATPGSIVLLHDGQYPLPTPKALTIIIDRLREQGHEFVTVSELLSLYEIRPTLRR